MRASQGVWILLLAWALRAVCGSGSAQAAGTVTTPNEAALTTALNGGGTVQLACDGTIALTHPIVIAANTTLDALGHQFVLSGRHAVRIISLNSGVSLTLRNLTISNGLARGTDGVVASDGTVQDATAGTGAGILNNGGTLTLIGVNFVGNQAVGGAGAFMESADPTFGDSTFGTGGAGQGGAVCNNGGSVTMTNCAFTSDTALGGDGGPGGSGQGGAVYSSGGTVAATRCTFSASGAVGGTGDDGDFTPGLPGGAASGGGLHAAATAVTLTACALAGNSASAGAGGAGSFHQGGFDGGAGGPAAGGGLYATAGSLAVAGSTFSANSARGAGGGLASSDTEGDPQGNHSGSGGTANGGALDAGLANAILTNCTLSGNDATGGDGVNDGTNMGGAAGGAVGGGLMVASGSLTATNCTVANNLATPGVAQSDSGDFGSNLTGHPATASGGNVRGGGTLKLQNTILAYGSPANASGTVTDGGHNLSSDNTPVLGATSFKNTDPLLGPLANNGGPTMTRGLYAGSPAVDHANAAVCPRTDQRGVVRPHGAGDDIGAFEGTIVDSVAPSVAITHPADRSVVRSFNSFQGTATDNSGVAHVDLILQRQSDHKYWTGTAWASTITSLSTTILTTLPGQPWIRDTTLGIPAGTNLPDGLYSLQATAFDFAGNKRSSTITFTVDKTLPAMVTIATPANASTVTSLSPIRGQATDNVGGSGIKHVDLILQRLSDNKYWTGTVWSTVSTVVTTVVAGTNWQRAAGNPTGVNLIPGRYELVARAFDQAENGIRAVSVFTVASAAHNLASAASSTPSSVRLSTCLVRTDTDSVLLRFSGGLDAETASDPQHYSVTVDGQLVTVESASYDATTHTVAVGLQPGVLRYGGSVHVGWQGLKDLSGQNVILPPGG